MTDQKITQTLLKQGIHPRWLKVEAKFIQPLLRDYRTWLKETDGISFQMPSLLKEEKKSRFWRSEKINRQQLIAYRLVKFLCYRIQQELLNMTQRREQLAEFNKRYSRAINRREQQQHILQFAKQLGVLKRATYLRRKYKRWCLLYC
jgi:hypothetical protein